MKTIKNTGKVLIVFMFMIFSCFFFADVRASDNNIRLFDYDNSIDDSAENEINKKILDVSKNNDINIAVVFTDDTQGKSSMEYADDFYDDLFDINSDGILMLVDHDNSNVYISTSGTVIGTYDERMPDLLYKLLHKGKNEKAVEKFLEYTSPEKLSKAIKTSGMKKAALGGFIASFLIALVVYGCVKHSYSVNPKVTARNYVSGNGVRLNVKEDRFLRTSTTKSVIESNSGRGGGGHSTHISSSGGTHGGSGHRI